MFENKTLYMFLTHGHEYIMFQTFPCMCLSHVRPTRTLPQICPSTTDTHRQTCPLYADNGQNISAKYTTIKGNRSNNCAHCTMKISYFGTICTRVRVWETHTGKCLDQYVLMSVCERHIQGWCFRTCVLWTIWTLNKSK